MALTKFPNGISSYGMPVMGGGGVMTTGSVFFVDSNTGGDGNSGADPDHAFATVDAAINACTASKGDVIFVMPGHSETATTAALFDADVAGISIIGLGPPGVRPSFTLGTSTGADIDLNATGVLIRNLKFDFTGVDAIVAGMDVDGESITIENCEFNLGDTSGQCGVGINVGVSSHLFTFRNNKVYSSAAGVADGLQIYGVSNDVVISNNEFIGDFGGSAIDGTDDTNAQLHLRINISDNLLINTNNTGLCINMGASDSGCTGIIARNMIGYGTSDAGEGLTSISGRARNFENYYTPVAGGHGMLHPAAWTS